MKKVMELTEREKEILVDIVQKELYLHGDLGYAELSAILHKLTKE